MESTGNGRRRQRQDIQSHAPSFQPLFLRNAKPLFLIHDQQAQVLERHIRLQQPVCADQNIHRPFGCFLQRYPLLGRCLKPADHSHRQAEGGKPAGKRLKMLLRQHRGRHQHRNLFTAHDSLERRPQRHFRFSEPNIAAEQAVHGLGFLHIRLDFRQRRQLIRSLLKGKGIFKFRLPGRVRQEGESRRQAAFRVQLDQFPGQVGDGRFGPGLGLGPVRSAQPRQLGGFAFRADIFLQ